MNLAAVLVSTAIAASTFPVTATLLVKQAAATGRQANQQDAELIARKIAAEIRLTRSPQAIDSADNCELFNEGFSIFSVTCSVGELKSTRASYKAIVDLSEPSQQQQSTDPTSTSQQTNSIF